MMGYRAFTHNLFRKIKPSFLFMHTTPKANYFLPKAQSLRSILKVLFYHEHPEKLGERIKMRLLLVALPFRSAISNIFLTRKQYPDIMS
jgi:hypothetical protein